MIPHHVYYQLAIVGYPTFKGVWSIGAPLALRPLPATRSGQSPRPPTRCAAHPGGHGRAGEGPGPQRRGPASRAARGPPPRPLSAWLAGLAGRSCAGPAHGERGGPAVGGWPRPGSLRPGAAPPRPGGPGALAPRAEGGGRLAPAPARVHRARWGLLRLEPLGLRPHRGPPWRGPDGAPVRGGAQGGPGSQAARAARALGARGRRRPASP